MACLNMTNSEQSGHNYTSSMNPRISFSNDFADTQQAKKYENGYREAPVSMDFEFSGEGYSMIPADEIFFKGVILPLKDNNCSSNQMRKMTTLREELLADDDEFDDDDDDDDAMLPSLPKSSYGWWKEKWGLKRNPVLPRKEEKRHVFDLDEGLDSKKTECLLEKKGSISERDGEESNGEDMDSFNETNSLISAKTD